MSPVRRAVSVSPPAKRAAHAVSVTAGRLTSPARMLPGFLIVGAQRCGTTSMYRTLSQHPAVRKPVLHKGVHYFDLNYDRRLRWYRAHFPLAARAALASRDAGAPPQTFESSPYYMFHPLAAARIAADLPDVKLLVLLRDPVERAYSAYAHERARGFEDETFEAALDLESARLDGEAERIAAEPGYLSHSHQHHAYRARGQYIEQLERLTGLFGRDAVLVVDSGDFFTKPEPVYDRVLDFLELPRGDYPLFERHNARPRSELPHAVRAALADHFRPYDERLIAWLDHEPSWCRASA
jgi:Sulfotransferase domain